MQKKVLGVFSLSMINVAAIISLRNLPLMAEYGIASVFFYILASLLFFVPTGLVCAELATGWPKEGGVYAWVGEAFGKKIAFITMWFTWMESIAWFPAVLSFIGATLAYIINPALAQSKLFMVVVILSVFWGSTFLNFLGMRTSSWVSALGVISGTLLPGALIIAIGLWWWFSEQTLAITVDWAHFIPDMHLDNIVLFSGVLLGFAGMELAAYHAGDAKMPQRDYPTAMFFSAIVILTLSVLGSLSIAFVVPQQQIGLVDGVLQAYSYFFTALHLSKVLPLIAIFLFIGALAGVNTWTIGPVKGILPAAKDGFLPGILKKQNQAGVPTSLLILQATIGSALALIFLLMPNVNTAFWVVTAISAQFSLLMYSVLFMSAIRLRYSRKHIKRAYAIPGKYNSGMWLVAGIGVITCVFSFAIAFIPPKHLEVAQRNFYELILVGTFIILTLPPFWFLLRKRK